MSGHTTMFFEKKGAGGAQCAQIANYGNKIHILAKNDRLRMVEGLLEAECYCLHDEKGKFQKYQISGGLGPNNPIWGYQLKIIFVLKT